MKFWYYSLIGWLFAVLIAVELLFPKTPSAWQIFPYPVTVAMASLMRKREPIFVYLPFLSFLRTFLPN